jgi:hypothetical protein
LGTAIGDKNVNLWAAIVAERIRMRKAIEGDEPSTATVH